MRDSLFQEFDPVSSKAWKQKIQVDLKGADYNETLIWQSLEGIHIKPFYHSDEYDGSFAPIHGHPKDWAIGQTIFIDDAAVANKLALDAIDRGAESISFRATKIFEFEKVFKDFDFQGISLHFQLEFLDKEFLSSLILNRSILTSTIQWPAILLRMEAFWIPNQS